MEPASLADITLDEYTHEDDNIRKLVEHSQTFPQHEPGGTLHDYFEAQPNAEGVVILNSMQAPVGLVMRNDYYQKLGSLYGRDLFMKRPVKLLMNQRPLIVDVSVDIAAISMIAMNRPPRELYDIVIVTENETYLGVVSVKRFMMELAKNREKEIELLKKQKEILHMANEAEVRHRKQIEEKSNQLREKNEAVKNLLDNAGQGFLSFGEDLVVFDEYSLECVNIFRGPIGGKHFPELMAKHLSAESAQILNQVFGNIFGAPQDLQQKVYLSLLPTEFTIYNKIVQADYKIITHMDQKRLMLVLTDITDKKELEQKMVQERKNLRMVVKVLKKQADVNLAMADFTSFLTSEAQNLVQNAMNQDVMNQDVMNQDAPDIAAALTEMFRIVHTFKGDFGQYGLHKTADQLHELENMLSNMLEAVPPVTGEQLLQALSEWKPDYMLAEDRSVIAESLGESFFKTDERFFISKTNLLAIEHKVAELLKPEEQAKVLPMLASLRKHNLRELLAGYDDYIDSLAQRLGKKIEPMVVAGDDVYVDKEKFHPFIKSLVHVFRNMIDHGVETPEDRVDAGKSEEGAITCKVKDKGEYVKVSIADDGAGVNLDKVRAKAVEKGVLDKDAAAKLDAKRVCELLFLDSLSTKDDITMLSGRGVGLAAVKAALEDLGGSYKVKTEPGQGTTFSFKLPLSA